MLFTGILPFLKIVFCRVRLIPARVNQVGGLQRSVKKYANFAKQGRAEQVSKSRNKLLATMYKPFSRSLYSSLHEKKMSFLLSIFGHKASYRFLLLAERIYFNRSPSNASQHQASTVNYGVIANLK